MKEEFIMIEKVNPSHPDKVADRIAGAIVDLGYKLNDNPKIAVEVLLGHGNCHIIIETDVNYQYDDIKKIVKRIGGNLKLDLQVVSQDVHLNNNQKDIIKCGDPVNGHATYRDKATGQVLLDRDYEVPANAATQIGTVPFSGQGLMEISYTADGETHWNHFLYGEPPFKWAEVQAWTRRDRLP